MLRTCFVKCPKCGRVIRGYSPHCAGTDDYFSYKHITPWHEPCEGSNCRGYPIAKNKEEEDE